MQIIINPKFPLGQIVTTANANEQLDRMDVAEALHRHASGDWGEVCIEDAGENDVALKEGSRLLSVYRSPQTTEGTKFWIITEWDRSITTILLPEDY
jgi:hypothetical protein